MGCGVTLTWVTAGAAPVTPPELSTGKTTCDMNTSQACPAWVLGSTWRFEPYHTTSARPAPPPFTHGNTETMDGGELTWVGALQLVHPEAALATLTKAWRRAGFVLLPTQATYRLRAESMDVTTKFALSLASAG